jgi:hypothetical protein
MVETKRETLRCTICKGEFPRLKDFLVKGCPSCERDGRYGPPHFSSDRCESFGQRQHAGCRGHAHCTCDGCF